MKFFILSLFVSLFAVTAQAGSVTANANLQRGSILQSDDISIEASSHENREALINTYVGMELKRSVPEGYRMNPAYVGKPILVHRNERVNMMYRVGRMEISAWGRALDEGAAGDVISIMNLESKKRIQGRILESGMIEVGQ